MREGIRLANPENYPSPPPLQQKKTGKKNQLLSFQFLMKTKIQWICPHPHKNNTHFMRSSSQKESSTFYGCPEIFPLSPKFTSVRKDHFPTLMWWKAASLLERTTESKPPDMMQIDTRDSTPAIGLPAGQGGSRPVQNVQERLKRMRGSKKE